MCVFFGLILCCRHVERSLRDKVGHNVGQIYKRAAQLTGIDPVHSCFLFFSFCFSVFSSILMFLFLSQANKHVQQMTQRVNHLIKSAMLKNRLAGMQPTWLPWL